jgi:hypothetical protein
MESVKQLIADRRRIRRRLANLEKEVQECREMNVRLAELCDVVTELLVPLSERDEAGVRAAIESYRKDIASPQGR